jgi:proline dehydrogenase
VALMRSLLLAASESRRLRAAFPRYAFMRRAVRRFMPGEELEDALGAARQFVPQKIGVILTRLGENITDLSAAAAVAAHYRDALDRIAAASLDAHVSVKLTQLGLDISPDAAARNVRDIVEHAASVRNMIWIDMEQSALTDVTIDIFRRTREQFDNIGLCLQSYLRRTEADLEGLLPLRPAIRMVKGAYMEPATIAFQEKREVDENFYRLCTRLIHEAVAGSGTLGVGSHDPRLIERIRTFADQAGARPGSIEYQMLYGIRRDAQYELAAQGQKVRVLISYGENWYPWFVRRLAEKPSNLLFVARNLVGK